MNFLPARMSPSMTSFSGCTRRWLFHRSPTSFSVCAQVVAIDELFASSHESVADFFLQVASVADIFHRSRPLLTFFLGCARRWLLFQVAHIADFFPGRARWWFFPTLRTSLISFSWSHDSVADFFFRLSLSMTSFSQVAPVKKLFFMLLLSLLFFFQVVLIDEIFASSLESFDDFFFRLRPTLTFSQVADFFFSLRTSLTFFQVAAVADFSPGYACRWFFPGSHEYVDDFLLRLRTSLTFFPGRARCWFFPSLRKSLFSFSWSHDSLADFFFRLCLSWTVFSQLASVATFFFMLVLSLFFSSCGYRWTFC